MSGNSGPGCGEPGTPWYGVRQAKQTHDTPLISSLLVHQFDMEVSSTIKRRKRRGNRRGVRGGSLFQQEVSIKSEAVREAMRMARKSSGKKRSKGQPETNKDLLLAKSSMRTARAHLADPMSAGRPFKVTCIDAETAAITSAAGGVGHAYNIQLDQLAQFADYVALFDQYRFTKITAHVMPRVNTHNLTVQSSAATTTLAPIAVTFDPDDSTTPASSTDVLKYPTCKVYPGYECFEYSWKPHAAIAAYGGAFTQFADFDGWCDCASDDVEWYAFKAWQFGSGASQTTFAIWDIFYVIEAEFRFVQ